MNAGEQDLINKPLEHSESLTFKNEEEARVKSTRRRRRGRCNLLLESTNCPTSPLTTFKIRIAANSM